MTCTSDHLRTMLSAPRVYMRADASVSTGFGHFMRVCALASMISSEFDVMIASFNADSGHISEAQRREILEAGAVPAPIAGGDMEEFDREFMRSLRPEDVVVLDNYYFTTEFQTAVRSRCRALVYIDDMHVRPTPGDVVITPCPLSREQFMLAPYARFYGGIDKALLRPPFRRPAPRRSPEALFAPRAVLVGMGGSDPKGLTLPMARVAARLWPGAEVHIVVGETARLNPDSVEFTAHTALDAAGMAALYDSVDLAFLPASTMCVEAFSRALPVVAGWYVDNQREFYDYSVEHGLVTPAGFLLDPPEEVEKRLAGAPLLPPPMIDLPAWEEEIKNIFKQLSA